MSASSTEGASSSGMSTGVQGDQSMREERQGGDESIREERQQGDESIREERQQGDESIRENRLVPAHSNVSVSASDLIWNPIRMVVSQNRRRFRTGGFNLDLTYITDRIIAMGYPADTKEAFYRNSMDSTVQFLEHYHAGHYKVFNLRGQYVYDTKKFHGRVLSFEMADHHPPRLEIMAPFCREVHEYLNSDPRNIVAVHCKAGKGRTGVMICAYLCYISFYRFPRQNMDYYSIVRTENNKGVTIPSQRRYVYYFSHLREKELNYIPLRCELVGIFLERPPKQSSFPVKKGLAIRVVNGDVTVFEGKPICLAKEEWEEEERVWEKGVSKGDDSYDEKSGQGDCLSRRAYGWEVRADQRVFLEGDVRVEIHSVKSLKNKIGHCWFNTMFTCQSFCEGAYIHGDEAFPYPPGGTTISEGPLTGIECRKSESASQPSSPSSTPKMESGDGAPSLDAKKSSRTPRLSHVIRKFRGGASNRNSSGASMNKKGRQKRNETDEDKQSVPFKIVKPPGLDAHCPERSLRLIYANPDRKPPREEIEDMVEDAHNRNMVCDKYNARRLSVPQKGSPVEKAPIGRPFANGPNTIMKREDEHVMTFSVLEMDKAYKNKEFDPGFKMIVVTRCLSDKESDLRLADKFIEVTREKQGDRDEKKREKVEARQRRIQSGGGRGNDEGADYLCASDKKLGDPRQEDPFLKKYFYRQRADSVSRYPPHNHRCPLVQFSSSPGKSVPISKNSLPDNFPSTSGGRNEDEKNGAKEEMEIGREEVNDEWMERDDHLDRDVRSYHPDDKKSTSCDSSTTTSSDSDTPGDRSEAEDDEPILHSSLSHHPSHSSPSPSPIPTPSIPS